MREKINYGFAVLLLVLAVMACKKTPEVCCNSPTRDVGLSQQLIVGDWRWAYSTEYNRLTGKRDIYSPQSEKVEKAMTFCDND